MTRLLMFTKPSMTHEYLNFVYNQGIKITNILGEEKVIEIMKSIEITNPEFFDEINNIIMNNDELSGRIAILAEMNEEFEPDSYDDYPIICTILALIWIPLGIIAAPAEIIILMLEDKPISILYIIAWLWLISVNIFLLPTLFLFLYVFECVSFVPEI